MLSLVSSFHQSALSGVIGPLFFCTVGILLTIYDLARMYRKSAQQQRPAWYERPLLWLGGSAITAGLVLWADMMIASLPDDWSAGIYILSFFAITFLMLICFVLMLASSENKPETPRKKARIARRALSKHIVVRENPLLATTRMSLLAYAAIGLMIIWGACGLFFHPVPDQLFVEGILIVLGLLAVWCIHRALAYLQPLKRIERLRIEFAKRTDPEASRLELSFPFQRPAQLLVPPILLRPTWTALAGWLAYGSVMGTMFTQPLLTTPKVAILIFKLSIILLIAGVIFFIRFRQRCKLEATQYDLTSVVGFQTRNISWQQARLFACYEVPGFFFKHKTTMIYELSGPGQTVQWTRLTDARSLFAAWRPVLPMDEYQRQMQELCNLITAKTGLPLYDLNKGRGSKE